MSCEIINFSQVRFNQILEGYEALKAQADEMLKAKVGTVEEFQKIDETLMGMQAQLAFLEDHAKGA